MSIQVTTNLRRAASTEASAECCSLVAWLCDGISALTASDADRLEHLFAAVPGEGGDRAELARLRGLLGAMVASTEANLLFLERIGALAVRGNSPCPPQGDTGSQ